MNDAKLDEVLLLSRKMSQVLGEHSAVLSEHTARLDAHDERFTGLEGRMESVEHRLGNVENRLGSVENRLGGVENRLGGVEDELREIQETMINKNDVNRIMTKLDQLIGKYQHVETESAAQTHARDRQQEELDNHEVRILKLEHTGGAI